MALFKVTAQRAQFDLSDNNSTDVYGAGIRFDQNGFARATTSAGTFFNQGIPMSASGQVSIVDATAGLPSGTIFHNGLPISGEKVCVSRNATSVVSSGLPFDSNGALAADLNLDLNFVNATTLDSNITFTRASSATYFDSAGVLQTATTNTPRFDYNPATLASRGLLIEEQRTNSIRNNTMQGAVAGTPGTAPTNWAASTGAGITRELIGVGVESGITYIDYRFSGTGSVVSDTQFDQSNIIAAASGQTWAHSIYCKVIAGSLNNITLTQILSENSAAGGFLASSTQNITPTSAALGTQRFALTRTLNNASTAFTAASLRVQSTGAIDITLRIGLPQLEQGAFATSVILTTTTALTRNADVASVNTLSPWFNSTAGTVYSEASLFGFGNTPAVTSFSDGTDTGNLIQTNTSGAGLVRYRVTIGGVAQVNNLSSGVTATANTTFKAATGYAASDFAISVNGTAAVTQASGNVPTPTQLRLLQTGSGGSVFSGHIRRITYYPRRLTNAELRSITLPTGATITTQDYSLDTNFVGNTVAIGS